MRKYILILAMFFSFQILLSQTNEQKAIRREIDSLKKVLPHLTGIEKVNCLNTLAYKFYDLNLSWKGIADSSYPYAIQANKEAKRIGYHSGLAYSLLRLGIIEDIKYIYENDLSRLTNAEKFVNQAISLGEKLSDNIVLGVANQQLGEFQRERGDSMKCLDYSNKAFYYYEKAGKQKLQGTYREYQYANCAGCEGNEIWLGILHRWLTNAYYGWRDFVTAKKHISSTIYYFQKTNDKRKLADAYSLLAQIDFRKFDYPGAEEASRKCISLYRELGDEEAEIRAVSELCKVYELTGDFEKGLEYCKKNILLVEKKSKTNSANNHNDFRGNAFFWMCRLYKTAGDYETAMKIIRDGYNYYPQPLSSFSNEIWTSEIGDVHRLIGNNDSALIYLQRFAGDSVQWAIGKINLSKLYIDSKQFDKAAKLITTTIEQEKKYYMNVPFAISHPVAAAVFFAMKDYKNALQYAREGLSILKLMNAKVVIIDNYKVLSDIFQALGKSDSAYYYLKQYISLKDSLLNRQFLWKLNSSKKVVEEERKTSQINLLNKDNQIKEQKLKQQATLRNSLVAGIILLFLFGLFILRNLLLKRKNERLRMLKDLEVQQLESEKKQAELEMQALRAQMNPHFIFNCLSSINRFILKNESKVASNYLTRFSRLMRMVLMNSQKPLISLDDELEMLEIYLEMERLRFKNSFDYAITFLNAIDSDNVFIPPLLLQPFCENAIWHGLMHKEGPGRLDIELSMQDGVLNCIITDNGVGRVKAEEMNSKTAEKEKSMGLKITTERLAILNREKGLQTFYDIHDLKDENGNAAGTKVNLKIGFKNSVEEFV